MKKIFYSLTLILLLSAAYSAQAANCPTNAPDGKYTFYLTGGGQCIENSTGFFVDSTGQYVDINGQPTGARGSNPNSTNPNTLSPSGGCVGAGCTYTPLEPIPGLPQTGRDFAGFLNGMFKLMFTLGGMMAVASLVYGGITYMVSEIVNKKEWAKKQMQAALWGLALLAAAWLILYTINPQLINFNFKPTTVNVSAPAPQTPGSVAGATDANGNRKLSDAQIQALLDYYRSDPSYLCTASTALGGGCAKSITDSLVINNPLTDITVGLNGSNIREFYNRCTASGNNPQMIGTGPTGTFNGASFVYICAQY